MRDEKFEIQRQWNGDPCGASTAPDLTPGTADSFRRVEAVRCRRFQLEGLSTRLILGAEDLPLASDQLDAVQAFGVLHHTPATQKAIHEIHRVLRPGGAAIVGLYHRHSAFHWVYVLLWRGIRLGELQRIGYRNMLSDIEQRSEESDARPLVKLVSRRDCRRLFSSFSDVRIRSDHIEPWHIVPFARPVIGVRRLQLERLAGR